MLDPFNDDRADELVDQLLRQKTLAPAKAVLKKAADRARKSWLDEGALCRSALAAAATVALARGWPDKSPVPDRLTDWLARTNPQADDALAALAAEVVEKLRVNSILQDITADVRDRSFKPGCADLIKRLKKPAQALSQPQPAKPQPSALSPAAARKILERQRCRFSQYEGRLTFIPSDDKAITEENLSVLACVTDLGQANLGSDTSPLTAAGLTRLVGLKKLQALGLRHIANDEMLAVAARMTQLRDLSLYHAAHVTDRSLRLLVGLTQLEELEIGRTSCDGSGLAHVPAARLKTLDLTGIVVSSQAAKAIRRFSNLVHLQMPFSTPAAGFFRELAGLKRLAELNLVGAKGIDDRALADLSSLGAVRELNLYNVHGFTDRGLAHLARLRKLESLDLRSTDVTGEGLTGIAGLPKLLELNLQASKCNDAGLAALAANKSLKELNLSCCNVTTAGVSHLPKMKSVRVLNLYGTRLSNEAASHLSKMTWLKELDVRNAGIPTKTQAAIRRALKKTEVECDR
jgi:hypothetical protein